MPRNIDLFDTYYLAGAVAEMVPYTAFFRDRCFQHHHRRHYKHIEEV